MDLDHEPPPPAKRKQGRTILFTELQSLSYAIEHFPPSTPKRCHLIADYVRLKSDPRDSLLLEINSPEEKRFEACHNDCQLIVSWLQNAIPAVTDFQSPFYSGFCDTTAFLPPVSQCCGRNLLIKNRPSHSRVYTTQGTDIAAIFTRECRNETCKSCHHYSSLKSLE